MTILPRGFLLLALAAPVLAAPPSVVPDPVRFRSKSESTVEMRHSRAGQPLVRVTIDGEDAGWFLFDTGSGGHVIDPRVARRFDLEVVGRVLSRNPSGEIRTRALGARTMKLGPATFRRPVFTELDLSALDEMAETVTGEGLAGVIGYPVLERCVVELDYRGERLVLHDPAAFTGRNLDWRTVVVRKDQPCVEASFEGHTEWLLIDTGSDGGALFFTPAVQRLDLLERETRRATASNLGGTLSYRLGVLEGFELAGRRWGRTSAQLATTDDGAHAEVLPAGLFGCVFLDPFTVFLDCGRQRAAFVEHPVPVLRPERLAAYVGNYAAPDGGVYEVRRSADRLYTPRDGGGRLWLVPVTETRLQAEDALLRFDFAVDTAGTVTHVSIRRGGGRPRLALRREPAVRLRSNR